nr:hypothetical protein [Tanacetum cinerariifolium]
MMRNMQNQINSLKGEFKNEIQNTMKTQQTVLMEQQNAFQNNLKNMLSGFFQNQSSTSSTLLSNTIPNPKGEMKEITTRSGVAYKGPSIPTPKKVVERETEETMNKEQSNFQESTAHIQPPVTPISEPDVPNTLPKPNIPYPSRLNDQKLRRKDRSITRPKGVAEDVFVKVGKFHFLTDFVVVDFEADPRVPLILGRSFLRTGRALIDVYEEEITLRVNDEAVTFNLNQTMRYSSTYDDLSINRIDIIDVAREEYAQEIFVKAKSSIEEPSELKLKELPSHLEYAYLEGIDKLPVIVSKDLKVDKKEALLKVLKSHKRAIAWKITNIKGIDPRFCTYKILMEEDYKPDVQSQRRVNPKIHEVIKKEVIKLLDAGMIYPISDSPWVSPIHCVPKKGGITVVENEKNEVIPTRMPFGLCNAPGTFQRCMKAIFHDMIEKTMEVFMDDFLVFEDSFSSLEVDHSKVDVIAKMPYPTTVKGVRSFLGHAGFYRRFIQDFSKIARPMTHLLEKETPFLFSKDCIDAFETLKKKLTEAPILVVPDWKLPFELIKTMTEAQIHYTTTEKEMIAVVYAFEKFRPYLVLSKSIVYTDHPALKYLLSKQDSKSRLIRTAYKTPIGCTPYKLVYGKSCHLPIELEHKAYWALKHVNFDLKTAGDHRKLQLNELNELCDQAYENSLIYKEKTKKIHDSKIKNRIFNVGDRVLLFNYPLNIFSRKLKTRWSGPFTITKVFMYGTVQLSQPDSPNIKVNGHRVKHYFGGDVPQLVVSDLQTFPIDK